jgi:hypothetical protein
VLYPWPFFYVAIKEKFDASTVKNFEIKCRDLVTKLYNNWLAYILRVWFFPISFYTIAHLPELDNTNENLDSREPEYVNMVKLFFVMEENHSN